mmetsp:Transcript_39445/g.75582  ORF Transcript_39445/g.75582 Transcript_39445/m.75582 type:complete len:273 (+) Transcript_39445:440-1258(+)
MHLCLSSRTGVVRRLDEMVEPRLERLLPRHNLLHEAHLPLLLHRVLLLLLPERQCPVDGQPCRAVLGGDSLSQRSHHLAVGAGVHGGVRLAEVVQVEDVAERVVVHLHVMFEAGALGRAERIKVVDGARADQAVGRAVLPDGDLVVSNRLKRRRQQTHDDVQQHKLPDDHEDEDHHAARLHPQVLVDGLRHVLPNLLVVQLADVPLTDAGEHECSNALEEGLASGRVLLLRVLEHSKRHHSVDENGQYPQNHGSRERAKYPCDRCQNGGAGF